MKKIFFSICFMIFYCAVFAQVDKQKVSPYYHMTTRSGNWEDSLKKVYRSISKPDMNEPDFLKIHNSLFDEMQKLKKGISFKLPVAGTNTACGDGNFENDVIGGAPDASEWDGAFGASGVFSTSGFSFDPSVTSGSGRQTIVGNTSDPTGAPIQTAHSGNRALRLGNQVNGYGNELIRKKFTVTAATAMYSFWYAVVMNNPTGHSTTMQPAFSVNIYDGAGNAITGLVNLGNGSNSVSGNSPMLQEITPSVLVYSTKVVYQPWTCITIDLNQYINQTVTIEWVNRDCTAGGHFGYTYLDDFCAGCAGSPTGSVTISAKSDTCMKDDKAKICVDYTLPFNSTTTGTVKLSLEIYQNGVLINTINGPLLTSGSQYCFTFTTAAFKGKTGCFDLRAVGDFKLGNYSFGNQYSNAADGWKPGQNNDLCICTQHPPAGPCCNIKGLSIDTPINVHQNDHVSYFGTAFNLPINTGAAMIQEIRASIISFEASYNNPECAKCYTPYNTMGTLKLSDPQPAIPPLVRQNLSHYNIGTDLGGGNKGVREIIWSGNPAVVGNVNPQFEILYPKPRSLKCCSIRIKACIKFTFKDAECNICEKIVCYDSDGPTTDPTACACGKFADKVVSINSKKESITTKCDGTATVVAGTYTVGFPVYNCNPNNSSCTASYAWTTTSSSGTLTGTGRTFPFTFSSGNSYVITQTVSCGGKVCDSCTIRVKTKESAHCDCGSWKDKTIIVSNAVMSKKISCNDKMKLATGSYNMSFPSYTCNPNSSACEPIYSWKIESTNGLFQNGTGQVAAYNFGIPGSYSVSSTVSCGGKVCDSCNFKVDVTGTSPQGCDCIFSDSLIITGKGGNFHRNASISCGGQIDQQNMDGLQIWIHPTVQCSCGDMPGTTTVTVKKDSGSPQTLTSPNYQYIFTGPGIYEFQMYSSCGNNQCSCKISIRVTQ